MKKNFWKDGRLAWPPIAAAAVIVATCLIGDYVWRVSSISGSVILGACILVVAAAVSALILNGFRSRP